MQSEETESEGSIKYLCDICTELVTPKTWCLILQRSHYISPLLIYILQRNSLHEAAAMSDKPWMDDKEGLLEVRKLTGKQKPWEEYKNYEGNDEAEERDHEGNLPIHLAMHFRNWQIARYLLGQHPKHEDPSDVNAEEVERFGSLL